MQQNRLLLAFLFGFVLLGIAGCQPQQPAPVDVPPVATGTRLRVKALAQDMPNNASKITAFSYDAQGRLSALLSYESPDSTVTWVEKSRYEYDAQNRLMRHQYQRIARPNSIFGPISDQHQFSYNAAGQIDQIRYSSSSYIVLNSGQTVIDLAVLNDVNTVSLIAYPSYNAAGQVTGLKKVYYNQGKLATFGTIYEYTYTGPNLTYSKSVATSYQGSVPYVEIQENNVSYDDKVNPFFGLYVIPKYYGGITDYFQNLHTLSPHNMVTIGGLSYRYEYNDANLPTVRYTYSDKLVETLRFQYESY